MFNASNLELKTYFRNMLFFSVYAFINLAVVQMVWKWILLNYLALCLRLSLSDSGAVIVIRVTQFCHHVPDCSIKKGKQDVRIADILQNLVDISTGLHLMLDSVHIDLLFSELRMIKSALDSCGCANQCNFWLTFSHLVNFQKQGMDLLLCL